MTVAKFCECCYTEQNTIKGDGNMGFAEWFSFKSAKQREKEAKLFARWAFPYGEAQREKVTQIMKELMPKEDSKAAVCVFLMGRQAYLGAFDADPEDLKERTEEQRLKALDRVLNTQLFGRYRKMLPYYTVMVLADAQVDETLNYPSVEELRSRAEALMKK